MNTLPDPVCVACGAPVPRKAGEAAAHWRRRRTCSPECLARTHMTNGARPMVDYPTSKTCPCCGVTFTRRQGEQSKNWRRRMTCTMECGNRLKRGNYLAMVAERGPAPSKPCAVCGKEMTRGYLEGRVKFENRKTCSRACHLAGLRVIKLAAPAAMGRPALAQTLRPCVGCGCVIPKPDTLTWARYRAKTTCGSQACKDRQAARPTTGGPSEIVADVTTLHRPTPKQRLAWLQATESERRLFAAEIRAAMGAG